MAIEERIEAAIERLTEISGELKTMIAVHEERINRQEKETSDIHITLEKRREEIDIKLKDVYDVMREQDNKIIKEIHSLREENAQQHKEASTKMANLERYIWMAIGGGITITWLLSYIANYFKILGH